MKVSNSVIKFRIDVDFEDCEVDMVLKEMGARGVQTSVPSILCDHTQIPIDENKLPQTPSEESVDFALNWLWGYIDRDTYQRSNHKWKEKTELEQLGIEVSKIYGLMQGTCHLICEVDFEKYSVELVEKANKVVDEVFSNFIIYYNGEIGLKQVYNHELKKDIFNGNFDQEWDHFNIIGNVGNWWYLDRYNSEDEFQCQYEYLSKKEYLNDLRILRPFLQEHEDYA